MKLPSMLLYCWLQHYTFICPNPQNSPSEKVDPNVTTDVS